MGNTESTAPGGRTLSFVRNVPREGLSEEELNEAAGHRDIEGTGSRWRTAGAQALRWKCAGVLEKHQGGQSVQCVWTRVSAGEGV